jgi:hypothetical protein
MVALVAAGAAGAGGAGEGVGGEAGLEAIDAVADGFDLALELERAELVALLDRALALLPADTRRVLVERYVEESPLTEIARRRGLSEGAVAMKLHRGRLAFRRVLAGDLRDEAAAFGLVGRSGGGWQETRMWCPWCGRRRLQGRFGPAPAGPALPEPTTLALRCPDCCAAPGAHVANAGGPGLFRGVHGYRTAYSRLLVWTEAVVGAGLALGGGPCWGCGRRMRLAVDYSPEGVAGWAVPRLRVQCPACGRGHGATLGGLLLARPEARRFWRAHPRLRLLPVREVEVAGTPALVAGFEAVGGGARWEAVCTRATLAVMAVYGEAGGR